MDTSKLKTLMHGMMLIAGALCALMLAACQSDHGLSTQTALPATISDHLPELTVYKSPNCGCCSAWVAYLEEEGFSVTAIDHDDMSSMKTSLGLTDPSLQSCHTAIVGDYLIEGHVPASDIRRLLYEQPTDIKGLTAPGMPLMSPGMASREPLDYDVLTLGKEGEVDIYSSY